MKTSFSFSLLLSAPPHRRRNDQMTCLPLLLTRRLLSSAIRTPAINLVVPRTTAKISMMAEATEKKRKEEAKEEEVRKRKELQLPVAPEKPEPGDCCGSGCVRCVWDVYYEELDAYGRALKEYQESMIGSEDSTTV